MASIISFEVNELPIRVVEDHIARRPNGALAKLERSARTFETICEDQIELDPWISWPTLHRGVIDRDHQVLHLGQSMDWVDRTYPPIWRLLNAAGRKVGVFGSLFSSNVPENARDYSFYVPDYFAVEPFAHPEQLMPFQEFNLVMTRQSARNINPGVPVREAARFGASALANGLSIQTLGRVSAQLASERVESHRKIRRRNMQGVIGMDLFMHQMKRTRPDYASYYTNHVAAAMHRYWAAHFTGDYEPQNPMGADWIEKYEDELPAAMEVLDAMLFRLMRYCEARPGTVLMVNSSLGQAAIQDTGEARGFTTLTDVDRFMSFLGLEQDDYTVANAMVPCISIDLSPDKAQEVVEKLKNLRVMGHQAEQNEREIAPLSFDLKHGRSLHLYFYFEGREPEGEVLLGNRTASPEDAGFGFFVHEDNVACSAHHIREGYLALWDPNKPENGGVRKRISTLDVAPALLRNFNVDVPDYMKAEPDLEI